MAPQLRMINVESCTQLSPHMMRIVFSSDELHTFPADQESAHVKVIIPEQGERPAMPLAPHFKQAMRSYTIRYFDTETKQLTIDFAVNDHQGPITHWANQAKPGDPLAILGPGSKKHTDMHADWHLFVADLTALPALAATLEALPPYATGNAVIQLPSKQDIQTINAPEGITLHWIVDTDYRSPALLHKVKSLPWPQGEPALFLAAEASQVKDIKNWLREQPGFNNEKLYASAYWNAKK